MSFIGSVAKQWRSTLRHLYVAICLMLLCQVSSYEMGISRTYYPSAKPQSIYFTGAGIYFWWQAGCAKYLQESCDISNMPVIGASAGSISATFLLANVDFNKAAEAALRIGEEARVYERKAGLAGIWGALLKQWLEEMIPENISPEAFASLQIALTPTLKTPKLVSGFEDRDDLIQAILASCHVPVFLDGRPTTSYRGEQVLDGSFWYFVTKDRLTGLPLPPNMSAEEIFWVDYGDDDDFMRSISGNILELASPGRVLEMIDDGYNFMKREHYYGRLPMARFKRPLFVYASELLNGVSEVPNQIYRWTRGLSSTSSDKNAGVSEESAGAASASLSPLDELREENAEVNLDTSAVVSGPSLLPRTAMAAFSTVTGSSISASSNSNINKDDVSYVSSMESSTVKTLTSLAERIQIGLGGGKMGPSPVPVRDTRMTLGQSSQKSLKLPKDETPSFASLVGSKALREWVSFDSYQKYFDTRSYNKFMFPERFL